MSEPALLKTPLHDWHREHGGRLVEFGGWEMPVQYGSIVEEHRAVRERAGLFDVSHMGRLRFWGTDAASWIDHATTNAVRKLTPGRVQYGLMVDETGGVIDDLLVYRSPAGGDEYLVVCNASNRSAVVGQFGRLGLHFQASFDDRTVETAMIAVQGPRALETAGRVVSTGSPLPELGYYRYAEGTAFGERVLVSRTGYTGEDGVELIVPEGLAIRTWEALLSAGREFDVMPIGLAARDTLRFEAAMPLHGHEMDRTVNPFAAGLGWAVKLDKGEFTGREALKRCRDEPGGTRVGLELGGKRIARQGCPVLKDGRVIGAVTSGTFAPTLDKSLAMARVEPGVAGTGATLAVDIRGREEPARVVPLPFYRRPEDR